jgi:branched-chain amino acid transport system ATP-binding protein
MSLLVLDRVSKRFGGLTAVNELSLAVEAGQIVGLLGPNGSGKTTALNTISGFFAPTGGTIRIDDIAIAGLRPHRIVGHGIARTFQLVRALPSLTVAENILAAVAFRREHAWGAAADTEITTLLERVGLGGRAGQRAADLTYIDLKRVELARALASKPRLLLLDEWLAGLNPTELLTGIDLIAELRQTGLTILLVEHVMDAVRALCDRCVVMNAGSKIAEGSTAEVLAHPDVLSAYLGSAHA